MTFDLTTYTDVRTKLELFHAKYPEGSIQFEFKGLMPHDDEFIWGVAYAYRFPNDPNPGMGTAQEASKGKTGFTRGSELQNLETSCWGRALSALGIGITQSIASADEVAFAQRRQKETAMVAKDKQITAETKERVSGMVTTKQVNMITAMFAGNLAERDAYIELFKTNHKIEGKLTSAQASQLIDELKELGKTPVFKDKRGTYDQAIKSE